MDTEVLEATIDAANEVLGSMWINPTAVTAGIRDMLTHRVADTVATRTGCDDPVGVVRSASYPVTLVLGGGWKLDEAEDWLVSSASEHLSAAEYLAPECELSWQRTGSVEQTALDALCSSQGTNLEDVVNLKRGTFAQSLAEELRYAFLTPRSRLCVLATMDWETLLDCTMCSCYPELAQQAARPLVRVDPEESPVVGLFDPIDGRSSGMRVRLERPLEIPPGAVEAAMVERASGDPIWGDKYGMRCLTPGCTLDGRVADLFGARALRCESDAMGIRR